MHLTAASFCAIRFTSHDNNYSIIITSLLRMKKQILELIAERWLIEFSLMLCLVIVVLFLTSLIMLSLSLSLSSSAQVIIGWWVAANLAQIYSDTSFEEHSRTSHSFPFFSILQFSMTFLKPCLANMPHYCTTGCTHTHTCTHKHNEIYQSTNLPSTTLITDN